MQIILTTTLLAALMAQGEDSAPPPPPLPAPTAELPEELEGVRLGQPLAELQQRFEIRSQPSYFEGDLTRRVFDVQQTMSASAREDLARRSIRRVTLESRRERVTSIKIEYSDRRETTFAEMEAELVARYGPPLRSQTSGPMQVGRAKGIRLYLWLRIWTWEAGDRVFTVEGEHYGDDKHVERPLRHTFRYVLAAR